MDPATDAAVNLPGLLGFAALLMGFGALIWFFVVKPDRAEAAGLAALAARTDWRVERHTPHGGRGYHVDIRPVSGDWRCRVTRYRNGSTTVLTTELDCPSPRLGDGMIVVGPGLSQADLGAAAAALTGHGLLETVLPMLLGDRAAARGLAPVDLDLPGASTFATPGLDAQAVVEAWAPHLAAWRAARGADDRFPILVLGTDGLRLRVRRDLGDPDELGAFVELGLAARGAVRTALDVG
ncbi:MAG: hypothetical protein R3F61_08830 [Myxococcota bacterium]